MPTRLAPALAPGLDKASARLHYLCKGGDAPDVERVEDFVRFDIGVSDMSEARCTSYRELEREMQSLISKRYKA